MTRDVARDWSARGFSCDVWVDPPGQVWAEYVHDSDGLMMLLEGTIELTFGGKTVRPTIGEEVFIPAGVRHTVRNIGAMTNRWYYGCRREG